MQPHQTVFTNFLQELHSAAEGQPSSLPFIKHQMTATSLVADNELFQVIVIGGSVFRKALVRRNAKEISIQHYEETSQPPFLDKEAFLSFIIAQVDKDVSVLGLNFAYPLSPVFANKILDGRLISGSKENTFLGLVGEQIGATISQAYKEKTGKIIRVAVANDAICLLLSGLTRYPKETLVGAIMGTGTNITLFQDHNAVNLESANFDKFTPSAECLAIDASSSRPGSALFEKETSGGYLYQHFNLKLTNMHSQHPLLSSTKELKEIALDREVLGLSTLARELITKSACYFSAQLAAIAAFKHSNITVIMEGSFYWKNELYREQVAQCLAELSPDYAIEIVHVDNSPIIGGAMLVA